MGMLATLLPLHILFPATRTYTNYFLSLSYHDPISNTYRQGQTDLIFLLGWVILFTLGRAVAIDWVFCPLARRIGVERKNEIRFSEQAWMALYYLVFWTLGMVGHLCFLRPRDRNKLIENSTFGRLPHIGWIFRNSGVCGLPEICPLCSSGIILCSSRSGCNKSS